VTLLEPPPKAGVFLCANFNKLATLVILRSRRRRRDPV